MRILLADISAAPTGSPFLGDAPTTSCAFGNIELEGVDTGR